MFVEIFTQVLILLILILLGVILTKAKMLSEITVKQMTDVALTIVTPCVIIKSFMRPFDPTLTKNLFIGFLVSIAMHIIYIVLAKVLIREKDIKKEKVLQFGAIFSNCGFMSIPLLESLMGDTGVFYGTSYLAVFNVFVWTYGVLLMGNGVKDLSVKKIVINPGIIGITIALLIFFLNIPIHKVTVIAQPIGFMAGLNTPIPMIIIGYHLANSNILAGLKNLKALFAMFLKLVVFPIITLFGMYFIGIRGELLEAITISASAPIAAITTMFSVKHDRATGLSVSLVSVSTVLSLITMPLIIALAKIIV